MSAYLAVTGQAQSVLTRAARLLAITALDNSRDFLASELLDFAAELETGRVHIPEGMHDALDA